MLCFHLYGSRVLRMLMNENQPADDAAAGVGCIGVVGCLCFDHYVVVVMMKLMAFDVEVETETEEQLYLRLLC